MYDFGQVTCPLRVSVSSSLKWDTWTKWFPQSWGWRPWILKLQYVWQHSPFQVAKGINFPHRLRSQYHFNFIAFFNVNTEIEKNSINVQLPFCWESIDYIVPALHLLAIVLVFFRLCLIRIPICLNSSQSGNPLTVLLYFYCQS